MSDHWGEIRLERRASERLSDHSMLLVNGYNLSGIPFSETTDINDVSRDGISFPLSVLVATDEVLDLRIGSPESEDDFFVPCFEAKARVIRVSTCEIGRASCRERV